MDLKEKKAKIDKMINELAIVKTKALEAKTTAAIAEQHAVNLLNHVRDFGENSLLDYIAELKEKIRRLQGEQK